MRGKNLTTPSEKLSGKNAALFVQDDSKKTASELSMDNVGGVFVVLMAGMGLGTLNHHSTKANHFSYGNHL